MHKMAFAHVFGPEKKNGFGPFSYKFFGVGDLVSGSKSNPARGQLNRENEYSSAMLCNGAFSRALVLLGGGLCVSACCTRACSAVVLKRSQLPQ